MALTVKTGQQPGELAQIIQENEEAIAAAIVAAFGLGGPWAALVTWIVSWILDECLDPWAKNRSFRSQLDSANVTALTRALQPVQSVAKPEDLETLTEDSAEARATWEQNPMASAILYIPWDQTVTVSWDVNGHAASPCHQDVAIAQIVGVQGTAVRKFFYKEAEGIARLFSPESVRSRGTADLHLTQGQYVLQAAVSGDYSSARITVEYETGTRAAPEGSKTMALLGFLAAALVLSQQGPEGGNS